jgi:hydroxymethylpyrimidine/phosphomethylpyrimidine kinase
VTPNIPEAEALSGCRIVSADDRRRAAERIHQMGAAAVVITGGHATGLIDEGDDVVDLLFDGGTFTELRTRRVGTNTHGTGCTFASALAAGLALGDPLATAAGRAQRYVAGAIAHGISIGHGAPVLNHFWQTPSA